MPSKYTRPSAADLAKRIIGSFTAILHTDHGIEEDDWDSMPEDIRNAFVEAVDMVVREELENIAVVFDREVNEVAGKKAQAIANEIISSAPKPEQPATRIGVCYYCGRKREINRLSACQECVKS